MKYFTIVLVACFFCFTHSNAQDQVRKLVRYDLNAEDHALLTREGSELPGLLISGVVSGELNVYRMSSYALIEPFEPEIHQESIVLRYVPANEEDGSLWNASEQYYYGDIVYQDGIMYDAIGHEFEGKPVEDKDYWNISDASLLNPSDLTQLVLDLTEQNGQSNNFIHFWYDDAWYGENYYLFSFKAEECEKFLTSKKIPIYKEADPSLGFVTGSVFISDALRNTNRELANQAISLPSYVQSADPYDDQLAVNLDRGAVFNTGDGIQLLGNFQTEQLVNKLQNAFDGFYNMGQFLHFLTPESEEEISINGAFVNDNDQVLFFDETVVTDTKDPYSSLQTIGANTIPSKLEGPFSMMEVMAFDLEYPGNPVLNEQGKQLSKALIEAVKAKKITSFYKDGFLTEKMTQESWVAELAVRDWEMEEEYRDLPYWDSNESYEANDKIIVSDTVYISEADFNRGNDPENFQGGFWKIDKIISNTETYKFEEFNLLYVVYEKKFDSNGKVISKELRAVQPVVGARYTVEEKPVTPGFIPIEAAAAVLSKYTTSFEGQTLTYDKVVAGDYLIGVPIQSGHIRLQ